MASRSDQLFHKRKAKTRKSLARRKATIPERRRVLIVCEGEKTEPKYLGALVSDLGLTTAEVEVCGECGSSPRSVVNFGEEKLEADDDFDLIFFVFDRDSHPDYDEAIGLVRGLKSRVKFRSKTVAAITSVPCFEIWFLLHFEPHSKPYVAGGGKSACGNLISQLRKRPEFRDFEKGNASYYWILRSRLEQAKKNSETRIKESCAVGDRENHGNPTTLMHVLISALEQVVAEYDK